VIARLAQVREALQGERGTDVVVGERAPGRMSAVEPSRRSARRGDVGGDDVSTARAFSAIQSSAELRPFGTTTISTRVSRGVSIHALATTKTGKAYRFATR
jgi:hypothetical protein